ncbi:MAG: hypothetical protein IJV15_03700 [Lachnospiraceae bacterium]|nr:hypothetical protein [Lachnospiraceae bacterium]
MNLTGLYLLFFYILQNPDVGMTPSLPLPTSVLMILKENPVGLELYSYKHVRWNNRAHYNL